MYNKKKRGLLATVGALVTAAALAFGGAAAASAAPGADGPLILPGEGGNSITGTVTVHKFEQGATAGDPADGRELTGSDVPQGDNIPGVTFTAEQIVSVTVGAESHDIVLTTNEGWLNAAKLERDAASSTGWMFGTSEATPVFGLTRTENTGLAGGTYTDAVFANLPVGLYLFSEIVAPEGVVKSAPWVMTVPLTHPTDLNKWLYDIHVYPKNSVNSVSKSVADEDTIAVGDNVSWTITGDVPLVANPEFDEVVPVDGDNLKFLAPTRYEIKDQLDPRLTPAATTPAVVTLVNGGTVSLVAADYNIVWDPTATTAGAKLTVVFTEDGRDKLALAVSKATIPSDVKIRVALNTEITSVASTGVDVPGGGGIVGDGIIKNQAVLFINDAEVNSGEPETRYGDILIEKVDANNTDTKLEGVEFKVFASEVDAKAGANAIVIEGVDTFTTGADGVVRISGLRHSNWSNNTEVSEGQDGFRAYWLVETKAHEGYELLAEPVRVLVTETDQVLASATQIKNVPSNGGFVLPLTGGTGTLLLTILGVGILAVVLVVARRRNAIASAE